MLIAIPIKENVLDTRFEASARIFEIADLDFENKNVISRKVVDFTADGDTLTIPEMLQREGVVVVICGMIGESLYTSLVLAGIEVLAGAPAAPSEDLYKALLEGAVVESGCGCSGCDCGCGDDCADEIPNKFPGQEEQGGGGCGCGSCGCH